MVLAKGLVVSGDASTQLLLVMPAERAYAPQMPPLLTADEFLNVNIPGKQVDLVRGMLVVREPPGYQHALTLARLTSMLSDYVERR